MPDSRALQNDLIRRLGLQPHPEGGFFSETYRSTERVSRENARTDGDVLHTLSASTAIYYLLCNGAHSAWHRIKSDEVWHFYAGEPLNVYVLDPSGALITHRLGNALTDTTAVFQAVVPAGLWFAAECADPTTFSLVGCTVAPGFEFSEFELAEIRALKEQYAQHAALIERLGPAAV